jgi:hypothetical protein
MICKVCHKEFNTKDKRTKFCSRGCFYSYRKGLPLYKKGVIKICKTCGEEFYIPQSRKDKANFCSNKCYNIEKIKRFQLIRDQKVKITKNCLVCGKEFSYPSWQGSPQCCSIECRKKANYEIYHSQKDVFCKVCGKTFTINKGQYYKTKYCSRECRIKDIPINLQSRNGLKRAFTRRGLVMEKCEMCGYSEHPIILGLHHKDFDPKNGTLKNLIVLCPNCHSLLHKRHVMHPPGRHS